LIGQALTARLHAAGHRTTPISRQVRGPNSIIWDPMEGRLDPEALADFDAVVHLAGESIASGRWTESVKRRIHDSRTFGTDLLARTLATLAKGDSAPTALVSASAIGYYGDRGDDLLTEESPPGVGFLANVCKDWEAATAPAQAAGIRVANVRIGMVQSPDGGSLKVQLPLYKLGLGGKLGSGQQYISWVSITDVVGILVHALEHDIVGPINATAPNPVTQAEYAATLGQILSRPAVLPVPRFGPKLLLGDMADELLFASARVKPEVANATGYTFRHPTLTEAFRALLPRPAA
jgi:uncharacterized protein (TIGR01777 family)